MSFLVTSKKPTIRQLEAMRHRYEISGSKLIVKNKYHCGPEVGKMVGSFSKRGYLKCRVVRRDFLVHQIVWFLAHDKWPEKHIDHIDGDKLNNNPLNLRQSDSSQNMRAYRKHQGGSSQYKGVCVRKGRGEWQAYINDNGTKIFLGYYPCEHEAAMAYNKKALELGYFPEALNKIGINGTAETKD